MAQTAAVSAEMPRNGLIDNEPAARYLGIAPNTLEIWRCTKRHKIPYLKIGRLVKYRIADLDAFLASCAVGADADDGGTK